MVVCDHLVPALAIADEILIVFRLDVRSLEIDAGLCQSVNLIDVRDLTVGGGYLLSARIMVLCAIAIWLATITYWSTASSGPWVKRGVGINLNGSSAQGLFGAIIENFLWTVRVMWEV